MPSLTESQKRRIEQQVLGDAGPSVSAWQGVAPTQAAPQPAPGYDEALVKSLQARAQQLGYKQNVPPSAWQGVVAPATVQAPPLQTLPGAPGFERGFRKKTNY